MSSAANPSEPRPPRIEAWSPRARAEALLLVGLALLCMLPGVPAPLALALGAAVALGLGHGHGEQAARAAGHVLGFGVVGLGFSVSLADVAAVSARGILATVVTVGLCLGLGLGLARRLRVDRTTAVLVAFGTAICGGTAIAAMAPVVAARREHTTVALATVFVLNAVAMVTLPFVGRGLGLDAADFGTLAALAVHDTSAVVGAASSFGPDAVDVATTVKLARALMLLPASLVVSRIFRRTGDALVGRPKVPWFVLGFVAAAVLVALIPSLTTVGDAIAAVARRAMVAALFLVGASTSRASLRAAGVGPFALGITLWGAVAVFACLLVSL